MEVLLQSNVANLGQIGELVKVKPGFARNFLFPRGLAILADTTQKKQFDHQMRVLEAKKLKFQQEAVALAKRIETLTLTIQKSVGEEDRIFGSITTTELVDGFKTQGIEVDKRHITISDDIKKLGIYKGVVKLHSDVSAEFKIWVVNKN